MKVSENRIRSLTVFSHEVKNISVGGEKRTKSCLRSEKGKKACFPKSQKINRPRPHLQALWECDPSAAGVRQLCLKRSLRACPRPGIRGSDTTFPSDDQSKHPGGGEGRRVGSRDKEGVWLAHIPREDRRAAWAGPHERTPVRAAMCYGT